MKKPEQDQLVLSLLDHEAAERQLAEVQLIIRYDIKEYPVDVLVKKLRENEIKFPSYQREFVWDETRQCKFIESVLMGLPIPFLFGVEDHHEGKILIVDGRQRLETLLRFTSGDLRLDEIDKLDALRGFCYGDLSPLQQRRFNNRTIRMILLFEGADALTQFELFERINTSPMMALASEVRRAAFPGPFTDFIVKEAKENTLLHKLCPISAARSNRREHEELLIRFFAYVEDYLSFRHDVARFLDQKLIDFNITASKDTSFVDREQKRLNQMLLFVEKYLPDGFARKVHYKSTPRVRFEAISVGVALALEKNPELVPSNLDWVNSTEFDELTRTDASNSGPKLRARIKFVMSHLLK